MSHLDDRSLTLRAGGGESHLRRAVIIDARSAHYRIDMIAIGEGVLQPLEEHDAGAAAENGSGRVGVERTACPIG